MRFSILEDFRSFRKEQLANQIPEINAQLRKRMFFHQKQVCVALKKQRLATCCTIQQIGLDLLYIFQK